MDAILLTGLTAILALGVGMFVIRKNNKPFILVEGEDPISNTCTTKRFSPSRAVNWKRGDGAQLRLLLADGFSVMDSKTGRPKFRVNLHNGLCFKATADGKHVVWGPDRYAAATKDQRGAVLTRGIPSSDSQWAKVVMVVAIGLFLVVGGFMVVNALG